MNIFGTPCYAPVIVREAFSAARNVRPAGGGSCASSAPDQLVGPSIELDGAGCCSFQGARPPPQHVTKAAQVETGKQSAGRARQRCLILVVSAHTSSRVSSASLSSLFSPVLSSAASQEGGKGERSGRSLQRRRESGDHQMSFCTGGFVCLSAVVNIWCSEWGDSAHWPLVAFSGLTNGQEWPKRANWSSTSQTRKMATETSCLLAVGSASGQGQIYIHTLGIFSVSGACVQNASTYPFPKGSLLWTS